VGSNPASPNSDPFPDYESEPVFPGTDHQQGRGVPWCNDRGRDKSVFFAARV